MATVAANKIAALNKLRCTIFQTLYNPTSVRTGAKYLRARLRGPSMINYYPPVLPIALLKKGNPGWEIQDEDEIQRLQDVEDRKKRGKGAPKKAKTKGSNTQAQPQNENIDTSTFGRYGNQLQIPSHSSKPAWQFKSPKITFGTATGNPLAPAQPPNTSTSQTHWPPKTPLQPKIESSLANDAYIDKLRIAEALKARDVAVERLESVCASVRIKQIRIENLEKERDRLKEELDGMLSAGKHTEGKSKAGEETKKGDVWSKQREKFLDEIKELEAHNEKLKGEIEILRKNAVSQNTDNKGEGTKGLSLIEDPDKDLGSKSPLLGASSPLLSFASMTFSESRSNHSVTDGEAAAPVKARYATLCELPIPPDMPSEVLSPILIPPPFTIHDFLGTITGYHRLANYRVFQECTTTWCPEREEHGYYLTPVYKCITNPRVSTAHRWVTINLEANFGKPIECFFHKDSKWYYAGVYKLFKLDELSTTEWEKLSTEAIQAIIKETLASRKNTSPQNLYETNQLYSVGALKVACIALQCIGFDESLYKELLERAEVCKKAGRWRGAGGAGPVAGVEGVWSVGLTNAPSAPGSNPGSTAGSTGATTTSGPVEMSASNESGSGSGEGEKAAAPPGLG